MFIVIFVTIAIAEIECNSVVRFKRSFMSMEVKCMKAMHVFTVHCNIANNATNIAQSWVTQTHWQRYAYLDALMILSERLASVWFLS